MTDIPHAVPTQSSDAPDFERRRWERLFSGGDYYYGYEPGPLARRAVRYHRAFLKQGGSALDAGCGEGQDLAFLASCGYQATGLDFIPAGLDKARNLIQQIGMQATVREFDLRAFAAEQQFDLVMASNSLQFLGGHALPCLNGLMQSVAPGGVIALSLFAREAEQPAVNGTLFFATLAEMLARFENWQPLEATNLWQWNQATGETQPFVTLIARNTTPVCRVPLSLK